MAYILIGSGANFQLKKLSAKTFSKNNFMAHILMGNGANFHLKNFQLKLSVKTI